MKLNDNNTLNFAFHPENKLNMFVVLKNVTEYASKHMWMHLSYTTENRFVSLSISPENGTFSIDKRLSDLKEINVTLQFSTVETKICRGRRDDSLPLLINPGVCLRAQQCYVVLNSSDLQSTRKRSFRKPVKQPKGIKLNNTGVNETKETFTVFETHTASDTERDHTNADPSSNTTTIISVVSVIVIIAVLVIAAWKCFRKHEAQSVPQPQDLTNRYYENIALRRKSDDTENASQPQIQESAEEPVYEEI
ncbi:uncharacterized protein LOC124643801 [Helicoverpa zea]|uniref:uncharacterized protein LOC124643801 n=1 Tax=Helicoverpa zea TaxID=7113 RepID=UPI001F59739D|nr:uncharacterized protein LOC124643801 [Helicoverpa zea]